jgi:transposase InsO family protein
MATSLHTEVLLKTRVFQSSVWAVDSGATHHFCNDDSYFQNAHSRIINMPIRLGDDNSVLARKEGPITLQGSLNLHALFVPDFRISLLSVPQFDKQGWTTTFSHERCLITNTNGKVLISATLRNGLYLVDSFALITTRSGRHLTPPPFIVTETPPSIITETPPSIVTETPSEVEQSPGDQISLEKSTEILTPAAPDTSAGPKARFRKDNLEVKRSDSIAIWHRRLAHLHPSARKKLLNIPLNGKNDISGCDTCIQAKHQQKFQRSVPSTRSTVPFELIHSDLCGPLNHSVGGASYYIVYIDDCTRWNEVYPLIGKTAAEITAKFQHFKAWVETQGRRIKRFRCDNGRGEYNNALFLEILASSGITYEPAPPYTQHKNGVAERMIRTLNTKARAMLLDAGLPMTFWGEAIKTACYLHHRTPTSSLIDFKSPYKLLHGVKPRLHHLRRFGCTVYKHIPKEQRHDKKFGIRSRPCMMIGYVHKTTKIWRLWV